MSLQTEWRAMLPATLLLPLLCGGAQAFDFASKEPALKLAIPGVPDIPVVEQAGGSVGGGSVSGANTKRVFKGRDARIEVELALLPSPAAVTPNACAGQVVKALLAQPGMPKRDGIYRAALDYNTFLVIYILGDEPQQQLHAHVVSAAGGAQCADAHFSRAAVPGEDIDVWRTSFNTARATTP